MLRVFVSYATRSTHAPRFLEQLERPVVGLDVDWWRDINRIRAGEEWRRKIDTALHDCHGAVLLLCPEALRSKADGERHAHASAQIWGQELRGAPGKDYRALPERPSPEVDAYFRGLEALQGADRSTLLAGQRAPGRDTG